jgi:Flp pilus assembly protein TadD
MKNNNQTLQKALQFMQLKDFHSAEKELNQITAVDQKNTQVLALLGLVYFQLEKFDNALTKTNQVLFVEPNNIQLINLRGMIFQRKGNTEEAIKNYEKAIDLVPGFKEARNNLIKLLIVEQKYNEAIDYLKPLVILNNHGAIFDLANIHLNYTKKFSESIRLFEILISNNTNDKRAYLGKIRALNYLNRNEEALIICDEFEKKFGTNDLEFLNYKGIIYKEIEDYLNSQDNFIKALEIEENEKIRRNLSGVYLLNKQFDKGWFYFTEKKNHELNKIQDDASIIFKANQGIGDQLLYIKIIHQIEKYSMYKIQLDIDKRLHKIVELKYPHLKIINQENIKQDEIVTDISNAPFVLNEIAKKNKKTFSDMLDIKPLKKIKNKTNKIVGLAWKSTNPNIGQYKSINLEYLIDILKEKEIHNLQYFDDKSEIESLPKPIKYRTDIDYKNDISQLYEIMTKLDVVITISNFTAHLAGFFEIPTILLIPKGKGNIWYWHNEKESFWYPSIRLVKQKKIGDWTSVKDELISLL